MDSKLYLTIVAVLGALYAIGFVLFPAQSLALYGVSGQPNAALNAQFFGAALASIAAISWFARDFRDLDAVRGVLIGELVGFVVGLLVNLYGTMQGLLNALAWSSTVLYVLLIAGAVSCLRAKSREFFRGALATATAGPEPAISGLDALDLPAMQLARATRWSGPPKGIPDLL